MDSLAVLGKHAIKTVAGNHGVRAARTLRGLIFAPRDLIFYEWNLKNGVSVWMDEICKRPIQPLKFRNGITWYHGARNDPTFLFREIFIHRYYEPMRAPANAHVLDIGANIGDVTLFWAAGRPDLRFHAYEPNPESYAALRKNVDANGLVTQVSIYPEAIGGARGMLDLWVDVRTPFATAYGVAPFEGARKQSLPMITLDDAWERMGRAPIWMLKIDTEGAEADILEGASDAVLANVHNACIEWHDNIVPGAFARCRDRLTAAGFKFRTRKHPWDEGIFYASRA
jgi:FkbM family methyltransferase